MKETTKFQVFLNADRFIVVEADNVQISDDRTVFFRGNNVVASFHNFCGFTTVENNSQLTNRSE